MKILREVKCDERLPKKVPEWYISKDVDGVLDSRELDCNSKWLNSNDIPIDDIIFWYEEVDLELKSEEILHSNARISRDPYFKANAKFRTSEQNINLFEKYHKALEAAELEIAELKAKYINKHNLVTRLIKDKSELIFNRDKKLNDVIEKFEDSKESNYIEALENLYFSNLEFSKYEIVKALRVAAGINK